MQKWLFLILLSVSSSLLAVAPKVTLTGDLPDSTAVSKKAQCLNSGNDASTSTAGVYDYGRCDDSLDASSINFYYQGPVVLAGSTSDACTVRKFDDVGILRVTFDSTTDCTVAVTATRESAPPPPAPTPAPPPPAPAPEQAPLAPATPVPTLPFYALILLAGLLGVVGIWQFKR